MALPPRIGVLLSGGLDSSILAAQLLAGGQVVQPFYIRFGLVWEPAELAVTRQFLSAIETEDLCDLIVLDLPLADLYDDHWSIVGTNVPGPDTPDEAVFLPGRNALLVIKAALWCQHHEIGTLALAPLASNPFSDASDEFFESLEKVFRFTGDQPVRIVRPFGQLSKRQVMNLGRDCPLEFTFSCISPHGSLHCGNCNKCAERQSAFRDAEIPDPTRYHLEPSSP